MQTAIHADGCGTVTEILVRREFCPVGKLVPWTVFLTNILVRAWNNGPSWSEHKSIAGVTSRVQFRAEESVKYQN